MPQFSHFSNGNNRSYFIRSLRYDSEYKVTAQYIFVIKLIVLLQFPWLWVPTIFPIATTIYNIPFYKWLHIWMEKEMATHSGILA